MQIKIKERWSSNTLAHSFLQTVLSGRLCHEDGSALCLCDMEGLTGHTKKGPGLDAFLCCHCCEILDAFLLQTDPMFSRALGPWKYLS